MKKEAIGVGESIEQALCNACEQLGIDTTEADDYEVLQQPKKKTLGIFGGVEAKVKVTVKGSPVDTAVTFLQDILNSIGLTEIKMEVTEMENGAEINLEGEDIGAVIGRRGDTLDALQYLTGLVANHVDNSYYRITLNTGNYREKREKTLEILGRKLAFKAIKTGYKTNLEPMNPYERRIIHTAVQKVNGAISWSEGERINRHVVIGPDPDAPKKHYNNRNSNGNYRNNRNNNSRNGENNYKSKHIQDEPTSTREPLHEGNLYGKL